MGELTPQEEATRWRRQAEADMKTARTLLKGEAFAASAFYSQQAAEKALKALLYSRGVKRPFGHSLVGLLAWCSTEGFREPGEAENVAADKLDKHYISSRYPDAFESQIPDDHYTEAMAEEALEWAQQLMQYSGENLPSPESASGDKPPLPTTPKD